MPSLGWESLQNMGASLLRSILSLQEGKVGLEMSYAEVQLQAEVCQCVYVFLNCGPATSLNYWASSCPSWQGSDMIGFVITSVGLLPVC